MSTNTQPVLDHIVVLVSNHFLANLPSWLTDALTVLPGGTHSDGLTENKLIVFHDGVYIELIAFVAGADPHKRRAHRWGQRSEGQIVDWACTLLQDGSDATPEQRFTTVQGRVLSARAGVEYSDPVPGGRITPDGTELRWAVSAPQVCKTGSDPAVQVSEGELPFWCFDRTPRSLRVPQANPGDLEHPNGAVGVASVSIYVKESHEITQLRQVYDAIADTPAKLVVTESVGSSYCWIVQVPSQDVAIHTEVILRRWSEESLDLRTLVSESVHISIALFTKDRSGRLEGSLGNNRHLVIDLIPLAKKLA